MSDQHVTKFSVTREFGLYFMLIKQLIKMKFG